MIRTVIIDDERNSIQEIEFYLKDYSEVEVVSTYTNPARALEDIDKVKPDLVLIDIKMPQMSGIDAAARILEQLPAAEIVFITAYDRYAVDAFEIEATDYILKPILQERFDKTMGRIYKKLPQKTKTLNRNLSIRIFGSFRIGWEKEEPIRWRTENTKQLFVYLLMNAGHEMAKEQIIDALWSDMNVDSAVKMVHNGIYYIRKILNDYGVGRDEIMLHGNYCLNLGNVDFDLFRWERLKKIPLSELEPDMIDDIYQGDYLEEVDWQWTDIERELYVDEYVSLLIRCAEGLIQRKDYIRAEACLQKAYKKNPYEEMTTIQIMNLYLMTSQNRKLIQHYHSYCKILREEIGIKPSKYILELYSSLK